MKPEVTENKIDFIARCIRDDMQKSKIEECQLLWGKHEKKMTGLQSLSDETLLHRRDVDLLLTSSMVELEERGDTHDHTKLTVEALELLKSCLDGTGSWKEWANYHFTKEDHHPEYWENKTEMPLEALMEMVADGASAQFARSTELTTFELQKEYYMTKKGWGDEMATVLANQFMKYYDMLIKADPYGNLGDKT